ncbi:PRC-barrel domain-containing protein [Marinimicrococcus flavescens]|uniref:PRC-barrel domain-containing protein n=1 Tax=Marinimicrococcus flavescens TaxID=3031815 RepID=A0AAP4D5F0_9PROT|nr:PRC-barrel domain-containing protein [Marinimicrococcus flavescens]
MRRTLLLASAIALASTAPALAASDGSREKQDQRADAALQNREVAQACLDRLDAFGQQMDEQGYWLTGWRGGWAGYGVRPGLGTTGMTPVTGGGTADVQTQASTGDAHPRQGTYASSDGDRQMRDPGPWGDVGWQMAPRYQIRTLYGAAHILARQGDMEGCRAVTDQLERIHERYTSELQQAGVDPDEVGSWRAQQIAAAVPVEQLGSVRLDSIAGTDLRNTRDEQLGSVEDVVIDPQSGDIAYAIVSVGGFLGIGDRTVAVPWKMLEVTPGYNTFVLDMKEDVLDNAPEITPEFFGSQDFFEEVRGELDTYWNQFRN